MADDAYTLADFETRAESNLVKGVIKTWRTQAPVMERLAWKQNPGLDLKMLRTKTLPTEAWVKIGETLPLMKGTTEPYTERVYKMGGKIDIPREYTIANSIVDERANQEEMALTSMAGGFNYGFMKGDPTVDPDSIVGLWYRLKNLLSSDQTVLGGGYDISPDTAVTDWQYGILDKLDALRDQCEGNDCDALIMDITTKQRLESLTGGDATTIYAVKFGEPYLSGFYLNDIRAEDKGELEDGVNVRTVVDWTCGLYQIHPRAIARLVGIVAA